MSLKDKSNVVASVLARLRNHAKEHGAPFQQVLQHYAIERFLYRISKSRHADTVTLKGALLLRTIGIPRSRPTLDIDMLRQGKADRASLIDLVKDCAQLDVEPDGVTFVAQSIVAEEITKEAEYKGLRVRMDARMENVRLRLQVDFGVGDVMVPGPRLIEYPVVLDDTPIQLRAYPVESAIAEKLQAIVALGNANSRMKDFYDIWICSRHLDFDADTLCKAIAATFENRDTPIPADNVEAFSSTFATQHQVQWKAFAKNIGEEALGNAFDAILADLKAFLMPVLAWIENGESTRRLWKSGKAWTDGEHR